MNHKHIDTCLLLTAVCLILTVFASIRSNIYRHKIDELSSQNESFSSELKNYCSEIEEYKSNTVENENIISQQQATISELMKEIDSMNSLIEEQKEYNSSLLVTIEHIKNPINVQDDKLDLSPEISDMMNANFLHLIKTDNVYSFDNDHPVVLAFMDNLHIIGDNSSKCWVIDSNYSDLPEYSIELKDRIDEDNIYQIAKGLFCYSTSKHVIMIYQASNQMNFYFVFTLDNEHNVSFYSDYIINIIQQQIQLSIG